MATATKEKPSTEPTNTLHVGRAVGKRGGRILEKTCCVCGRSFTRPWKQRRAVVCSRRCRGIKNAAMFRNWPQDIRDKCAASARKRGDECRGTGKKHPYVKRGNRHEHRVVVEGILGRRLGPDEIVHHKDGNAKNNNPDNLQLTTRKEHIAIHDLFHHPQSFRWTKENAKRGEQQHVSKLTDEKVISIRAEYAAGGTSCKKLGKKYGVHANAIHWVVRRRSWTHI